jgi:hypothetical protein
MGNRRNSCVNPSKLVGLTQLSCVYKQVSTHPKRRHDRQQTNGK